MRYSKEEVIDIGGDAIIEDRTASNPTYDWIDLVGIPQRPTDLNQTLFFATYSDGAGGWDNGFDRRKYALKRVKDTGDHLVIDQSFQDAADVEFIRINSLYELAYRLFAESKNRYKPITIGVTGSVGKTTATSFLEHLLRTNSQEVVRFYSKRLSSLSVVTHFINRVNNQTSFIVMEYSAYWKDHVSELARLLPPDISFLTNIYDTHIDSNLFHDKKDIFDSKVRIKQTGTRGVLNRRILLDLNLPLPEGWMEFETVDPEVANPNLPPTLRTSELYTIGKLLSKEINIPDEKFEEAFQSFLPQENRILLCNYFGKRIFFHGETSGGSRLWSWFETTNGTVPWLLVEEVNFADENPSGFKDLLEKVFNSDKTYVLDSHINRTTLPVQANFVSENEFANILSNKARGYIVYHKALATRTEGFNPEVYLKNRW